jgi:alkaline phosphatase
MGGGAEGMSVTAARAAGYTVVTNGAGLKELDLERQTLVCGPFGPGSVPPLSEMTAAGLHVLDNDRDGFFLMVEGGDIDGACHGQNLERCVGETVGFGRAVQAALEWALGRTDTVIIVTADHETGGLAVTADTGAGKLPEVRWSSTGHTAAPVGVYAWGTHAAGATNLHDNTDIFRFIRSVALPPAAAAAR